MLEGLGKGGQGDQPRQLQQQDLGITATRHPTTTKPDLAPTSQPEHKNKKIENPPGASRKATNNKEIPVAVTTTTTTKPQRKVTQRTHKQSKIETAVKNMIEIRNKKKRETEKQSRTETEISQQRENRTEESRNTQENSDLEDTQRPTDKPTQSQIPGTVWKAGKLKLTEKPLNRKRANPKLSTTFKYKKKHILQSGAAGRGT